MSVDLDFDLFAKQPKEIVDKIIEKIRMKNSFKEEILNTLSFYIKN